MKTYIVIESSYDGFVWRLTTEDKVKASGYANTQRGAWNEARRRANKIRQLQRVLDIKSLVDSVG
jgi:Uncharacterized protein conserved in bacteria (DUF2188)